MKRLISRLGTLLVLLTAGCYLYASSPIAAISCWEQAYNKWMGCDGAYFNTKNLYQDRTPYCENNAAMTCGTSSRNHCNEQAAIYCANSSDPVACREIYYDNCYPSVYNSCLPGAEYNCLVGVVQTYDNRFNAYSSCLGMEGNYGNCVEQVEFSCSEAQGRAAVCASVYAGSEDYGAYSTCVANSGINQCQ